MLLDVVQYVDEPRIVGHSIRRMDENRTFRGCNIPRDKDGVSAWKQHLQSHAEELRGDVAVLLRACPGLFGGHFGEGCVGALVLVG